MSARHDLGFMSMNIRGAREGYPKKKIMRYSSAMRETEESCTIPFFIHNFCKTYVYERIEIIESIYSNTNLKIRHKIIQSTYNLKKAKLFQLP